MAGNLTPPTTESKQKEVLPDIPTSWEKMAILIIFGGLAGYMAYKGNIEAASGYATTIATYFLVRPGA